MKARKVCLIVSLMLVSFVVCVCGGSTEPYHIATDRLITPYSHSTISVNVQINQNEPATFTMEMWAQADERSASVIVDASAEFMIGIAFVEGNESMTAWWPGIGKEETYSLSQGQEQLGFTMSKLDKAIWQDEDYTVKFSEETENAYRYRIEPKQDTEAGFLYGLVTVTKPDLLLSRAQFWNEDGPIETDTVEHYQEFALQTGEAILYPTVFTIENLSMGKKTTIQYSDLRFPELIDDEVFTLEYLKQRSAELLEQGSE